METRTILSEGAALTYSLERKSVKNLNLRIRRDGSIYVSANRRIPAKAIDDFVAGKSAFIRKAQAQMAAQRTPAPRQFVDGERFFLLGQPLELKVSQGPKNTVFLDAPYIRMELRTPGNLPTRQRSMQRFRDEQCRAVFGGILAELYPKVQAYGAIPPTLHLRDMETRWGSCLPGKGAITLNKRLLGAPRCCIEYVAMHELCHLIHPNHSKAFHDLMTTLMPDWKAHKHELNESPGVWGF